MLSKPKPSPPIVTPQSKGAQHLLCGVEEGILKKWQDGTLLGRVGRGQGQGEAGGLPSETGELSSCRRGLERGGGHDCGAQGLPRLQSHYCTGTSQMDPLRPPGGVLHLAGVTAYSVLNRTCSCGQYPARQPPHCKNP